MANNIYTRPPASGQAPQQIVLLLHGLGSNGKDLISLAPYWAKDLPNAVFISPDAPFVCDMVPAGYPDSYQWFSLQDRNPDKIEASIKVALPLLTELIDNLLAQYRLSADKLALVGFSQGTMMSLYTAPRYQDKIAGVLGYSGALFGSENLPENTNKPPIRLIHGEGDDVVPVMAYHDARTKLEKRGFDVSGHTTPGLPHSIDEHGIQSGGAFLADIFS